MSVSLSDVQRRVGASRAKAIYRNVARTNASTAKSTSAREVNRPSPIRSVRDAAIDRERTREIRRPRRKRSVRGHDRARWLRGSARVQRLRGCVRVDLCGVGGC